MTVVDDIDVQLHEFNTPPFQRKRAKIDARKSVTAVADEARRWENVDIESIDWDA